MRPYATEIGKPEEKPDTVVFPLEDPVPRTNPRRAPEEPTRPLVDPNPTREKEREKVPA